MVIAFFYLIAIADFSILPNLIAKASLPEWIIIFTLFLILSVLRGVRFHFLSGIRFSWIYIVVVFHNFFRDILPIKERELAYVKKVYDLGYSYDTPVFHIVTIRLYDIILSFFFLLLIFALGLIQCRYQITISIATGILFILMISQSSRIMNVLGFFIFPYIRHASHQVSAGLEQIQKEYQGLKKRNKFLLTLFSTVNAFFSLFIWCFILYLFFPQLKITEMIVASFFFKFMRIVPVYPILGLGVFELTWHIALFSTDLSFNEITVFSLIAHGIFLTQSTLIYFIANLIEFKKKLNVISHLNK